MVSIQKKLHGLSEEPNTFILNEWKELEVRDARYDHTLAQTWKPKNLKLYAVLSQYPHKCGLTRKYGYLGQYTHIMPALKKIIPAFSTKNLQLQKTNIYHFF